MSDQVTQAILPIAGLGTRLLPTSLIFPKELWPILDTPILQIILEELQAAGIQEVIFVINHKKTAVQQYFSRQGNLELKKICQKSQQLSLYKRHTKILDTLKFKFCYQKEARGDGHALLQAQKLVRDQPFLVAFGDEIVLRENPSKKIFNLFQRKKVPIVALAEIPPAEVSHYGIIQPGQKLFQAVEVLALVEKPLRHRAPSNLALTGKYLLKPEIFTLLKNLTQRKKEVRVIEALQVLVRTQPIWGQICQGIRLDTGNPLGFFRAQLAFLATQKKMRAPLKQCYQEFLGS